MEHLHLFPGWTLTMIVVGKLLLAVFLGGLVGFERESHGQAAGLRTNIIITLTACLLMLVSVHMQEMYAFLDQTSSVRIDPGRIASYALAGMGFLGAGAIIKGKGTVRGLTTAATLWLNTAVGLAVGAGLLLPAILSTSIILISLYIIRTNIRTAIDQDLHTVLTLVIARPGPRLREIREVLDRVGGASIETVNYHSDLLQGVNTYRLRLFSRTSVDRRNIIRLLETLPGLRSLSWQEADVP